MSMTEFVPPPGTPELRREPRGLSADVSLAPMAAPVSSPEQGELIGALAAFQAEVSNPPKNHTANITSNTGRSFSYQYADMADVLSEVRPKLGKHGLAVTQIAFTRNAAVWLRTTLAHKSGQYIYSEVQMFQQPGRETDMKFVGAQLTYWRRYLLCAMVGVQAEEDVDDPALQRQQAQTTRPSTAQTPLRSHAQTAAPAQTVVPPPGPRSNLKLPPRSITPELRPEVERSRDASPVPRQEPSVDVSITPTPEVQRSAAILAEYGKGMRSADNEKNLDDILGNATRDRNLLPADLEKVRTSYGKIKERWARESTVDPALMMVSEMENAKTMEALNGIWEAKNHIVSAAVAQVYDHLAATYQKRYLALQNG